MPAPEYAKAPDPERLDLLLVVEAELPLDLDLDPEALAVEAVLVPLPLPEHGVVALVEVLVGAAPGVVHAHRVVGRDRPVDEAEPLLRRVVSREVAGHRPALPPALDDLPLERGNIQILGNRLELPGHRRSIHDKPAPELRDGKSLPRYHPRLADARPWRGRPTQPPRVRRANVRASPLLSGGAPGRRYPRHVPLGASGSEGMTCRLRIARSHRPGSLLVRVGRPPWLRRRRSFGWWADRRSRPMRCQFSRSAPGR